MLLCLYYVPIEKMVKYYKIVIMAKLEDMTRSQPSTVARGRDNRR
jgi:hypothetical protein